MERNVSLNDISDGRLYGLNDMVRADCNDCMGCHACCEHMGDTIVLDPLDVFLLMKGLSVNFEELLISSVRLNVYDGIILPCLNMRGEEERCTFLDKDGRCSIHSFRPGMCRIFPLGRVYEDNSFKYFLQVNECRNESKSKVKVKKWIDADDTLRNQKFINDWHYHIKDLQEKIKTMDNTEDIKKVSMMVLNTFYLKPYDLTKDFYNQFYERFI